MNPSGRFTVLAATAILVLTAGGRHAAERQSAVLGEPRPFDKHGVPPLNLVFRRL